MKHYICPAIALWGVTVLIVGLATGDSSTMQESVFLIAAGSVSLLVAMGAMIGLHQALPLQHA